MYCTLFYTSSFGELNFIKKGIKSRKQISLITYLEYFTLVSLSKL